MKFKDICNKYGTKFVFDTDMPPRPYMIIDNDLTKGFYQVVSLIDGKVVYGFNDQDPSMNCKVTLIQGIMK